MATLTVYAAVSDGQVTSSSTVYSEARGGTGSLSAAAANPTVNVGQQLASGMYYCYEDFIEFNTSGIPDAAVVSAADLTLFPNSDNSGTDFIVEARAHDWGGTVDTADWVAGANLGAKTLLATRATSSIGTLNTAHKFASDAGFPGAISKTGWTRILLCSDRHRLNTAPPAAEYVGFVAAESTGTTSDPTLIVTYNEPPGAPTVTSPNGGETIDASHTITWNAATDPDTAQSNLKYHIQYSPNGGTSWSDVVALTAAGATSHAWNTSALAETTQGLIRIRAWDGSSFGAFDQSNATFTISHNVAPNAPTLTDKSGFDATTGQTFGWTFSDPNVGDSQSAFQLRIFRVSDGVMVHDTGKVASTTSSYTLPANTLANGNDYQWETRTWDNKDSVGPYSARDAFSTSAKPTATITSPAANGDVVATSQHTMTWTFSDPESEGQRAFRVVLKEGLNTVYDSGKVLDVDDRGHLLQNLVNGASYSVELTTWDADDIASDTVVRTFTVSYTPPPIPSIAKAGFEDQGFLRVAITNPAPSGTEPAVSSNELYRRAVGETVWVRIAAGISVGGSYDDYAVASGTTYEYRARALGSNGTSSDSTVVQASIVLRSTWLHDPSAPAATIREFKYDGSGRGASHEVAVALHEYAGRSRPVAEFGDGTSDGVSVELGALRSETDKAALQAVIDRRTTVCYRDGRGRKIFGVIPKINESDEVWGAGVSFEVIAVDHSEAV